MLQNMKFGRFGEKTSNIRFQATEYGDNRTRQGFYKN